MNRRDLILALVAAALPSRAATVPPDLPLATDFAADAKVVRQSRTPLVVLFSLPHCPYCHEVRRSHLLPLLNDGGRGAGFILRQVNLGGDARVDDFDGHAMTHGELARAGGVRTAPEVVFWDDRGRALATPLRGMLLPDFYAAYLDESLDASRRALAAVS
jgi:thioredoxin-related protein